MATVISNQEALTNISANLTRMLAEREMSMRELAKATGDAHMTIVNAVNGFSVPSAALISRIAEVLAVSIDSLLAPPPKKPRRKKSA